MIDDNVIRIVTKHGLFKPRKGALGNPIYFLYTQIAKFKIENDIDRVLSTFGEQSSFSIINKTIDHF